MKMDDKKSYLKPMTEWNFIFKKPAYKYTFYVWVAMPMEFD